jgi:hypothetical protein
VPFLQRFGYSYGLFFSLTAIGRPGFLLAADKNKVLLLMVYRPKVNK